MPSINVACRQLSSPQFDFNLTSLFNQRISFLIVIISLLPEHIKFVSRPIAPIMADYVYSPIKGWQIRLLKIYPGLDPAPLQVELLVADLFLDIGAVLHHEEEQINYAALSYAWGRQNLSESVLIGNRKIAVSLHLKTALQAFRRHETHCFVWADALCINQSDDREKSQQVQKMFAIYTKAAATMAYLGPAGKHTHLAMTYLKSNRQVSYSTLHQRAGNQYCLFAGLEDLFSRPWNRRVWIQQEVTASRNVRVRCGEVEISFAQYRGAMETLKHIIQSAHSSPLVITENLEESLIAIENMQICSNRSLEMLAYRRLFSEDRHSCECFGDRVNDTEGLKSNPECVLSFSSTLLASNSRDHVYGLLGLMNCPTALPSNGTHDLGAGKLPHLVVDYSKSIKTIFEDLTKYIIARDGHLGILWEHWPSQSLSDDLELPSWCPDWRTYKHRSKLGDQAYEHRSDFMLWELGGEGETTFWNWQQGLGAGAELHVNGILFVTVNHMDIDEGVGKAIVTLNKSKSLVETGSRLDRKCTLYCLAGSEACIAIGDLVIVCHEIDSAGGRLVLLLREAASGTFAYITQAELHLDHEMTWDLPATEQGFRHFVVV